MTVSFSELFGQEPSLDYASAVLQQYRRGAVLLVLAKVSAVLKTWRPVPDLAGDRQLARLVFRNAARPEYHVKRNGAQRVFFPRSGILAAARLALDVCPADGDPIQTPNAAAHVLGVCLMMNELIASGAFTGTLEFLTHQLPYHNGMIAQRFQADLVRSMAMFEESASLRRDQQGLVDLSARFEQAVGMSPLRFAEISLLVGSLYVPVNAASLIVDDPAFFLRRDQFATTTLTADQITAFLSATARTDAELAELSWQRRHRPLADTTLFQAYPLIRLPDDQYFCLDLASLLDKAGRGLYWTIALGSAGELGGTYGRIFESYLHKQVRGNRIPPERYLPRPLFSDGAEVCDAVFAETNHLVLCEYKSSVLPAAAKFGGDSQLLHDKIDKTFITGDKDGRKGVAQLKESIKRILNGDPISGLPNRDWAKIYPVMVCLDAAMTCPGMSRYLNDHFDRPKRRGGSPPITPLTIVDVEDYEGLLPDLAVHPFDELLDSYYRAHARNRLGQVVRFRRFNIPYLHDCPTPPDPVEVAFQQFFADLGPRVFKDL